MEFGLLSAGYLANRLTGAGVHTYRTYLRFRRILREDEEFRELLYESIRLKRGAYCIQKGMELALREK